MLKPERSRLVFLDANIMIQAGRPPGGPMLSRVQDLVEASFIVVLTTDLTVTEVAKKHAQNDYEAIKDIGRPHFRRISEELLGIKIPDITKADLRKNLIEVYDKAVKKMFKDLDAKFLSIDQIRPSTVFNAYAQREGLFLGEGKKDQFPDAFIFECLRTEASARASVVIVSNDDDFDKAAVHEANIVVIKNLPSLFESLGLQVDAPEVDEFLNQEKTKLVEMIEAELMDWGLIGDVEDSEVDQINVNDVGIEEMRAFRPIEDGGSILVVGYVTVAVSLTYTHPDWDTAMYDSDTRQRIPFETVEGDLEVTLDVDVSISISVDEEGQPLDLEELEFRNGDFQYVVLDPYDPYL